MGLFRYSRLDFFISCCGLLFLFVDFALDLWALVKFYRDGCYWFLGVLLLLLCISTVLVQVYSWLWFSYGSPEEKPALGSGVLNLLHVLQLGMLYRHGELLKVSVKGLRSNSDMAVYQIHDLSMLRLVETFSESAPQLVLMLTFILQEGDGNTMTVMKAIGSASAIALTVTTYHRSLRSFLPEKNHQSPPSSAMYFLWNLLLVSARLVAVALFSSVQPCFIFTHFFCSWLMFSFIAWRLHTDFMDTKAGERLYRATVGVIWYFTWFSVVEGPTRFKTTLYHGFMLVDISVLCSVWCWKMSSDPPYFVIPHPYTAVISCSVVGVYILGIFLKVLYYMCFHPNLSKDELRGHTTETPDEPQEEVAADTVDSRMFRLPSSSPSGETTARCNKRMRKLAENFYT